MASRWMPALQNSEPDRLRIHTDTSDFFRIAYGDLVLLDNRPYLIRQSAREGRFGLEDEVKHWVKHAIDLEKDAPCFIKLVFHEKFTCRIGGIEFECFRSPLKEARILELTRDHKILCRDSPLPTAFGRSYGMRAAVQIIEQLIRLALRGLNEREQTDDRTKINVQQKCPDSRG